MKHKFSCLCAISFSLAALSLSACGSSSTNNSTADKTSTLSTNAVDSTLDSTLDTTTEEITEEPTTVFDDDGTRPNVVNFYIFHDNTGTRDKLTEFYGPFEQGKDIRTFACFSSSDASVYGSRFADMWFPQWERFEASAECKIGYKIHIYLKDGSVVEHRIISPSDVVTDYTQFVETWIYDDVHHAAGEWYSHLTPADVKDDTVITSVKLTCGPRIEEVDYVVLDTFIYYNDAQFDSNGDYIGPIKASVKVCRDTYEHVN